MCNYSFEVYVVVYLEQVAAAPAVVDNYVFQAVVGGKVYIIFICVGVHARLEVHARNVQRAHPVPGHAPGFYPRNVVQTAGRGQLLRYVAVGKLRVVVGNHYGAPRHGARAGCFGNVVAALVGLRLECGRFAGHEVHALRHACKAGADRVGFGRVFLHEHAWVVFAAGVENGGLYVASQIDDYGYGAERVGKHLRYVLLVVERLVRV